MSDETDRLDRRSVLRTMGAAAAVGTGLTATTGTAAAESDPLASSYRDEHRLRVAFDRHGTGLRDTLVAEGLLPEDFEFHSLEFEVDADPTDMEPTSDDRRAAVTSLRDAETPTALGVVSVSTDDYEVALYVQPERDEAYAVVEPHDGDERLLATEDRVAPVDCTLIECSSDCCSSGFAYKYVRECYEGCETCYATKQYCSCSSIC